MTITIVALTIAFGLILLAIELFLVPGFSVPGIAGITMIGYGIFKAGQISLLIGTTPFRPDWAYKTCIFNYIGN